MLDFLQSHRTLLIVAVTLVVLFVLLHSTLKKVWAAEKSQFIAIEARLSAELHRAKERIETLEHELAAYRFGGAAKLSPAAEASRGTLSGGPAGASQDPKA